MRLSKEEAKKILSKEAYKKVALSLSGNSKTPSPITQINKEKHKLKVQKELEQEQLFASYFKEVFEPDYKVVTQTRLIPDCKGGLRKFAVDVFVKELKLCGELDGYRNHGLSKAGFKRDRVKDRLLMLEGIEVVRFFASEVIKPGNKYKILDELRLIREAREKHYLHKPPSLLKNG